MPEPTITVREVLRLLWKADSYPRLGNEGWPVAARMEAEALEKAATAVASPDDPREFAGWLEALQRRDLSLNGAKKSTGQSMTILPKRRAAGAVIRINIDNSAFRR